MTLYTEDHLLMLEKGKVTCEDFEEALCDYADGDLPHPVQARLDDHAAHCEECAELKRTYLLTIRLAETLHYEAPLSNEVQNRLRDALNERLGLSLKPIIDTLQ